MRQIDIDRLAAVQARLGILHRSHNFGRVSQIERPGGDEVCVISVPIRSNDDTHRGNWSRKESDYKRILLRYWVYFPLGDTRALRPGGADMAMFLAGLEPWCWNPAGGQRTVGKGGFGISIRRLACSLTRRANCARD